MSENNFRAIFRRAHAGHAGCRSDEWLSEPCRDQRGRAIARPVVWSRRNGPWHTVEILWVGAAPGNAGGRGAGVLGAHGTRIPFGGDVAGANLDVLLGSIGTTRNDVFITAALNQLPRAGGGEPTLAELNAPVGDFPSSLHLLRDTMLATHAPLIIALGNVGLRALIAAARLSADGLKLPSQAKLEKAGFSRGRVLEWPPAISPDADFARDWNADLLPHILWLTHPSAQNMSPFAGRHTRFHARMIETLAALRNAVQATLGWRLPEQRHPHPPAGIYGLKEWRELIGPRHEQLDRLWRAKGV